MPVLAYLNPLPLIRPILLPPIHIASFLVSSVGWTLTQFTKLMPSEVQTPALYSALTGTRLTKFPQALVQFLTTALFLGLTLGTIIALVHYFLLRSFGLSPMSQRLKNSSQYGSRRLGKRSYERGYSRYGREWEDEMGYTGFFGGRMEKILEEEEEEGW
ncbi:hypothetical protein BJ508DRAFT_304330 [Ascobolus immersus RN42]|uniref:Uncharacterized protein n=1 Tax=Ascobolus immersus RN42 TaxID=1160509 RepID=A0A3N4IGI6_ASCIM|nr:hypothetical protein BJ508DRAFT_304330 [Ascobolus immersus RN42]